MKHIIILLLTIFLFLPIVLSGDDIGASGCSKAKITRIDNDTWSWKCTDYKLTEASGCFKHNVIVYTADNKSVELWKVKIGDTILDGYGLPTQVIGFLHKEERTGSIIMMYTIDDWLEITPNHLLFTPNGTYMAKDLKIYNKLLLADGTTTIIEHIRYYTDKTLFIAPLTASGTIQVGKSKIRASCYAEINYQMLAHIYVRIKHFFSPYTGEAPTFDIKLADLLRRIYYFKIELVLSLF